MCKIDLSDVSLDEIIKVADAKHLLPFGFNNDYLKMD